MKVINFFQGYLKCLDNFKNIEGEIYDHISFPEVHLADDYEIEGFNKAADEYNRLTMKMVKAMRAAGGHKVEDLLDELIELHTKWEGR